MKKILLLFLLFIIGCSNPSYITIDKTKYSNEYYKPNFTSLVLKDADFRHYDIIALIKKEIKENDIPIVIADKDFFQRTYLDIHFSQYSASNINGLFVPQCDVVFYPDSFVYIDNSLGWASLLTTIYHEIGHYKCYKKGCLCQQNTVTSEYHAYKYSLEKSLETKNKEVLSDAVYHILLQSEGYSEHSKAAQLVLKTDIWLKCLFELTDVNNIDNINIYNFEELIQ